MKRFSLSLITAVFIIGLSLSAFANNSDSEDKDKKTCDQSQLIQFQANCDDRKDKE